MYIASIVCNVAKSHWKIPSQWMYYHLLDGDLASNICSWQWVAGSFSSKKYYANQENINRYLYSNQTETFLDCSYEKLSTIEIPDILKETIEPDLKTFLPENNTPVTINSEKPVCIYTSYWLHPEWRSDIDANRILILEPSHFEKFPVGKLVMDFILNAGKENIKGLQIFTGEFEELKKMIQPSQRVYYLDHPLHKHFTGTADPYPWMFPEVKGNFSSFFSFWKKVEKKL
jgi:deoxyribodipyrimidine photo-lyase